MGTTMLIGSRRARWCEVALIASVAACGGHKAAATSPVATGDDDGGGDEGGASSDPCADGMCPPEILDGITQTLDRKRTIVARCLADAVRAGTAPKNAHGQIALEFVVTRDGHAKGVKVTRSTVKSAAVDTCVADKVAQMTFPEPPKDLDWSYTYAFESN